jgi:hypothetical protein
MIFPLSSVSRPALGPTQPPVQWVTRVLSPGVRARPGRDADHSPPSSAKVEYEYELYLLSPPSVFIACNGAALAFFIYTYIRPYNSVGEKGQPWCTPLLISVILMIWN